MGSALLLAAACGGSSPETKSVAAQSSDESGDEPSGEAPEGAEPTPAAEANAAASATDIPTECVQSGAVCTPPPKFAKRLCAETFPSVALFMFAKGTPWTRGYLTRKTNAWNASGGASEQVELEFDEEVLILLERKPDTGGIQVSGAGGGYEALRWDGTCVTLAQEELTTKLPPAAKYPKVEIKRLETGIQDALRENPDIDEAYKSRRQECKGQMSGTVSLKCVKADQKLSKLIVEHVKSGGKVPKPERLP